MSAKSSTTNWTSVMLPIMGLVALIFAGASAFFLSVPAENLLLDNIAGLPADGTMQIVAGIGIFLLVLMVFGMLYAMVAPKPKTVHETQLKKEVEARRAQQRQARMANRQVGQRSRR